MDIYYRPLNTMCALAPLEVHHCPSSGCINPHIFGLVNKIPRALLPSEYYIPTMVAHIILAQDVRGGML